MSTRTVYKPARYAMLIRDFIKQIIAPKYQKNPSPEFRSIARTVYFGLHFVLGFYVFYLLNFALQKSYMIISETGLAHRYEDGTPLRQIQDFVFTSLYWNSFQFKSAAETLYLIFGVIWGSLGWDRLKCIKTDIDDSLFFNYFVIESGVGIALLGFVTATTQLLNQIMEGVFLKGAPILEVFWVCTLGASLILGIASLWTIAKRKRFTRNRVSGPTPPPPEEN